MSTPRNCGKEGEFPNIEEGKDYRIRWRKDDLRMACCDCGLIHRIRFFVRGEWLVIRAHRDGRLRKKARTN